VIPPTKANYNFAGWAEIQGGTAVDFTGSAAIITGDKTFYALWTALPTYAVTFDLDGGNISGNASNITLTAGYGQHSSVPVIPPTKANYNFAGWAEIQGGTAVDFTGSAAIITGYKTFYALWTALPTYAVTFDLNGGTLDGLLTNQNVIAGQRVIAPTGVPWKAGCMFTGWSSSSGSAWDFSTPITENKTIHAQWYQVQIIVPVPAL
jgi:uncharacterized repeat protein (TIGR02543 family)